MILRLLALIPLMAAITGCANPRRASAVSAPPKPSGPEAFSAYLFAHFTGESPSGEQIYFAVSEDGLRWTDLNNSEPVLVSGVGEKGVRDPSLIRLADGKKFILLATDLRIANGKGWGDAMARGSTSLVFWESADLVNWSEPWTVDVASSIPEAGCAWAPEAIYDESRDDYFVYWATISPRDGARRARIYGARTKDFRGFTAPGLYIDRTGENGGKAHDIIDTQILEVAGARRRFYRASGDGQITFEAADSLAGPWERTGDLSHLGYTGKQVEGPILFKFNDRPKWGVFVDQYSSGRGYLPFESADLDDPRAFRVLPADSYSFGASRKRHGGVLNITRAELDALRAKWPSDPQVRLSSPAAPGRYVRHFGFRLRLDAEVNPSADGLWRLAPGLSGAKDAVSFRSANFPDRYLAASASGVDMAANDGGADFAARATFVRVPGLADPSAASFVLPGSPARYLRLEGDGLGVGPAFTDAERARATFLLRP